MILLLLHYRYIQSITLNVHQYIYVDDYYSIIELIKSRIVFKYNSTEILSESDDRSSILQLFRH